MLRFNWRKIYRKSGGRLSTISNILYDLTYREHPSFGEDYTGQSYLLNPDSLFEYKGRMFSVKEMVDYVYLASFRSYGYYLASGDLTLPKEHQPFEIERLQKNKLIILTETSIKFKLEDNKQWH